MADIPVCAVYDYPGVGACPEHYDNILTICYSYFSEEKGGGV